ncbi:hypothetical protein NQ317_018133 [Molorchus minor]|uniref:Integrase p58-like C-terminal domain-containing protein n=1 Tax=Molorchus minor TaxID=1323400 RepID=A0ABQ9IXE1_9CUCU|nr:hypothetical protein NQ317_018133 [Molorchus minor]
MMEVEASKQQGDKYAFTKTPVPLSKSPVTSPSIRSMTQTVIVSLAETVIHDITNEIGKIRDGAGCISKGEKLEYHGAVWKTRGCSRETKRSFGRKIESTYISEFMNRVSVTLGVTGVCLTFGSTVYERFTHGVNVATGVRGGLVNDCGQKNCGVIQTDHAVYQVVHKNQRDLDRHLPFFLMAYRAAIHETTKQTPARVVFGHKIRLLCDLVFGTPRRGTPFRGRSGLVVQPATIERRSPKLHPPWEGPYSVITRSNDVVYGIQRTNKSKIKIVHFDRLAKYAEEMPDRRRSGLRKGKLPAQTNGNGYSPSLPQLRLAHANTDYSFGVVSSVSVESEITDMDLILKQRSTGYLHSSTTPSSYPKILQYFIIYTHI